MWGLIGFYLLLITFDNHPPNQADFIGFAMFSLSYFLFTSWQLYFFRLSKDYLIVKNHYFFWITKIYRLDDIKEVIFARGHGLPIGMRIITKDYEKPIYQAGSLSKKTWRELKKSLESKGVKVTNRMNSLRGWNPLK